MQKFSFFYCPRFYFMLPPVQYITSVIVLYACICPFFCLCVLLFAIFLFAIMSNVFVLSEGRMLETKSTKKTLLNTHNRWIERRRKKNESIHVCVLYNSSFSFSILVFFSNDEVSQNRRRREPWKYAHRSIIHAIVNMMARVREKKKKKKEKGGVFFCRREEKKNHCAVQSWPCYQQARLAVLQKSACLFLPLFVM